MKTSASILIEAVKKQLLFNPSIESFEKYLRELFSTLSLLNSKHEQCIDQITFQEYFTFPMFISGKLFSTLTSSLNYKSLNEYDFVYSLLTLFFGDYDHLLKLLTLLFEYDSKGIIHKENIQLLFKALDYDNYPIISEIIDETFQDSQWMTISKFYTKAVNSNGDIPILFLMYLIIHLPFNEDDINYFSSQTINTNKSVSAFISNSLQHSGSSITITISNKMLAFISEKIGVNFKSKLVYLHKEANNKDNDNYIEDDDMEELNAFEEDLSTIISNIEIDMFQNIRRKSEVDTNFLNIWNKHNISLTTSNQKSLCLESTLGSDKTHASSLTTFMYEKKKHLTSCYNTNFNNTNKNEAETENETLTKTVIPHSTINDNLQSTFLVSFMNKYNQLVKCKLIIIHNTMYIEKECQYKHNNDKLNNEDFLNLNLNLNNKVYMFNNNSNSYNKESVNNKGQYGNSLSYKYFKLIPLRSVYVIDLGSIEIDDTTFNGMKLVSHMHNISYDIIFYSQDASHLAEAIDLINKTIDIKDIKEDYDFEEKKEIGQGSYSRVYYGINKQTKEKVAIKEIENYNKKKDHLLYKRECEILQYLGKIDNGYVVKLIDIYKSTSSLYMVFEYLEGITLMKYLQENINKIPIDTRISILTQVANGINFLHSNGIIHRDIKADNIIITSKENKVSMKIIDFGFASVIGKDEYCHECYGTLLYIAPELLMRKRYNFPADIWSFGIVLYQILFDHLPFGETIDDLKEIQTQIKQINYTIPSNTVFTISQNKFLNVLKQCLVSNPDKRPNSNKIIDELNQ